MGPSVCRLPRIAEMPGNPRENWSGKSGIRTGLPPSSTVPSISCIQSTHHTHICFCLSLTQYSIFRTPLSHT